MRLSDLKPLHDAGLSLIYLHERDKRPLENNWTKNPNKTWKEIKNVFNSANNIGVRLGTYSHLLNSGFLCCIDVDIKHPSFKKAALKRLKEITGNQVYAEVRSGSGNGSRHLYGVSNEPFKMIEIEKHKHQWEICAYSTGRQMVLPPSIHPSGAPYVWRTPLDLKNLAVFDPSLFLEHSRRVKLGGEGAHLDFKAQEVDLYSSKLPIPLIQMIEEGTGCSDRSASLLSLAMTMCRYGFTDNEILSVLSDPNHWIAHAAYEHTQSQSRARAVKWLHQYTLTKARYETDIMRRFENVPDLKPLTEKQVEKVEEEFQEEKNKILPDVDGHGKPKSSLRNLVHILDHFLEGKLVGFNEFANRTVFLRDTPYGGKKGREVSDKDDLALKHYIACHYRFEPSKEICYEAHSIIAQKNHFHPVQNYLKKLKWDGVRRLDQWLVKAFKASGPSLYLQAISRKVLVAAITRVMEPGCKFDYVLVLEGHQGKGKSTALATLASPSWFTDGLGDIYQKDVVDQMTGKWLIEMAELASIRKVEIESVKAFITRQVDRVRPPYGRRSEDFPRQSIFIGSTNNSEYFSDETGNRRFWPVAISQINRDWLIENRDQLWAEAKMRYELGEAIYLSDELEVIAQREQEKRFDIDEWEVEIKKIVIKEKGPETFTSTEIWRALHITDGDGHPSKADTMRIAKIMVRLKFKRITQRVGGIPTKCWIKH